MKCAPCPRYKASGVDWLGAVPEHWEIINLAKLATSRCDGPFGSGLKSEHYVESGVRVVRLQNIRFAAFDDTDRAFIAEEYYRTLGDHDVLAGDLLVAGLGDENHPVGRACVAPGGLGPAMVKADCFRFRLERAKCDPRFAAYQLSSTAEALRGALASGTTRSRMNLSEMARSAIAVPPIPEQRAIADYLDRETARLDALVTAKERLLAILAEKRRALITRAVTRGLDPAVRLRDSGIPWLGEVPAHWNIQRVAVLFRERDERCEPELPLLEVSINSGVVLREFADDRIETTAADFNTYKVARAGDIVFNKMRMWQGAVGVAPQDGLVSPDYLVAAPEDGILPEFAGLLFRTEAFSAECARESHGIVWDRLRLYWEGFRDIRIQLPPIEEQRGIVARIQRETVQLDALRDATARTIALLKERRSALITAAVTGRIDVEREESRDRVVGDNTDGVRVPQ